MSETIDTAGKILPIGDQYRRRAKLLNRLPIGSRIADDDGDVFVKTDGSWNEWVLLDVEGKRTRYTEHYVSVACAGFTVVADVPGDDAPVTS